MMIPKSVYALFGIVALFLMLTGDLDAAGYQHSVTVDKMIFDWSVNGGNLAVKISAPTTGWVGIGFNATDDMKDANIILGYVKDGKVEISDEFGVQPTLHTPDAKREGGKDNVTVIGGSETGSTTTLEFTIPLRSGDPNDGVIDPKADTTVILAYGPERKSLKLKHQYAKKITVTLDTGVMK